MARLNDNNVGAISGAVRDMVSEQTNRAMNGHGFPEAPKYAETDVVRPRSGPFQYVLAAVLLVAALLAGMYFLSRSGNRRSTPKSWNFGKAVSIEDSERRDALVESLGKTIWLDETEPGVWLVVEPETGSKRITYDSTITYYHCVPDRLWFWYDTEQTPNRWQCWYEPISADYGDYGWLECRGGIWYVEEDEGRWVRLPEKYDTAQLWSIQSE